mmetsp:Transcript_22959/g.22688  ORF Transcript_22959/g.22688 Transcript_22959/m.22688 type:complete len:224 (+) Transcript_22959:98-769(+)
MPIPSAPSLSLYPELPSAPSLPNFQPPPSSSPPKKPVPPRAHQSPPQGKKEEDAPDILFDAEEPEERQNPEPQDLSSVPEFYSQTCTLQGKWIYHMESSEIEFPEATSDEIERDFISGNIRSKFNFSGSQAEILFRETLMTVTDPSGEKMIYPISRTAVAKEKYWWYANDQTARPIIKEIEDILSFTEGIFSFTLDGVGYQINLHKKCMVEMRTGLIRNLIIG